MENTNAMASPCKTTLKRFFEYLFEDFSGKLGGFFCRLTSYIWP